MRRTARARESPTGRQPEASSSPETGRPPEAGSSRNARSAGRARRAVVLVMALLGLVIGAAFAGYPVYVSPRTDPWPSPADPADAAVALGGTPESAALAWQLFQQGRVRHLVLSNPYHHARNLVTRLCTPRFGRTSGAPQLTCFVPEPSTTRGEAREIARLAQVNHWDRVVVVAPTFHVSRARVIIERCFPGHLAMIAERTPVPVGTWVYQYAYQTGGFAKVLTQQGC